MPSYPDSRDAIDAAIALVAGNQTYPGAQDEEVKRLASMLRAEHGAQTCASTTLCLNDNDLAELVDGVAASSLMVRAESHLGECPLCRRQLRELFQLVSEVPARAKTLDYLVSIAKHKLHVLLHPEEGFGFAPLQALPALRPGIETSAIRWTQELGDGASLEISLHALDQDRALAVLRQAPESSLGKQDWPLALYEGGVLLHAESLAADAAIEMELQPGRAYRLQVEQGGEEHHVTVTLQGHE